MPHHTAETLRRRARRLRRLAAEIEAAPVLTLDRFAGDDTWRGQRPLDCRNVLRTHQARLGRAAEGLRWQADDFDRRAGELDRLAALQPGTAR